MAKNNNLSKFEGLKTKIIEKVFNEGKPLPYTVDLPVGYCYGDGIIELPDDIYCSCLYFNDTNYVLKNDGDKVFILERLVELINGFTEDAYDIEMLCFNQRGSTQKHNRSILLKNKGDGYDYLRSEYSDIISSQINTSSHGIVKKRYYIVSVKTKDIREARRKLNQIITSIQNNLSRLKVVSDILDRNEYIDLFRAIVKGKELTNHCNIPINIEKVDVNKMLQINTIEYMPDYFKIDNVFNRVSTYHIIANKLSDRLLNDLISSEINVCINFHIEVIEQEKALSMIRNKWVTCNARLIAEQQKSVAKFYDSSLASPNVKKNSEGIDMLLTKLENTNEKMFWVTVTVMNSANSIDTLNVEWDKLRSIVVRSSNRLQKLNYMQEEGFINSLPIAFNKLEQFKRNLTTFTLAIFEPFTTKELNSTSPEALYYGTNAISKNVIVFDRKGEKELPNPNGLILGAPGMGKSFMTKLEILKAYLVTNDYIYIIDPEGEYTPLVESLGGQVIRLAPTSKDYINMFDISYTYSSNPITAKIGFFETIVEQMLLGSGYSVSGDIRSSIKHSIAEVFDEYKNQKIDRMPILEDVYKSLKKQNRAAAEFIVPYVDYYVGGDDDYLNHQTNVNLKSRIISFNLKELLNNKRELAITMLIVIDFIWARVAKNFDDNISTWTYIDEFHILLNHPQTASYMVDFWKRFRKWGGIPTGITQNVKDFLLSPEVNNIFDNTLFLTLLSQGADDLNVLSKKLQLTEYQTEYLAMNRQGVGLFKYNADIIPFSNVVPKNTQIYKLISTDPRDRILRKE